LELFVDMLNHNSPAQAQTMYDKFSGCYTVMAGTAVSIGQQIFVCYGGHDNAKLYIEYGFTLPDNVHNKVSLSTEEVIQLADELKITIGDAQRTAAIQAAQPCTLYASDQAPSWGLIVTVRILLSPIPQSWKEIAFGDRGDEDEPEIVEAVDRILRRLKEQIQLRIDGSPEAVRWLWEEQNAVVLGCHNRSS